MDESRRVFRAAGVVGGATLLSRILGFVRDAVIAWMFVLEHRLHPCFHRCDDPPGAGGSV
ncbi:MAG: hypothetical protein JRG88_13030 [Deltaproteobacteria bacterium]|nr:hypothetical protein [Deltaproteobacteria bacterium]